MTNKLPVFSNDKGLKILLVEDNPDDETLMLEVFKDLGLAGDVHFVRDGQEALDYVEKSSRPNPDLIIIDLKIPKISGIEVIKKIRKNQQTALIPIVIFSSSMEENDLKEGYSAGANSYIRKPVDFRAFSEDIHQIVRYWLRLNEAPIKKKKDH